MEKEKRNQKNKSRGNGEGTIYYSEALKCWVAQYVEPNTGKRKTLKQKKNEGVTEFKNRFKNIMNDINKGTYVENNKDTFLQILSNHIDQKFKDNITSSSSYNRELNTKKQIEDTCSNFVNKPIQKVTIEDIEYAKEHIRDYSNNSINKIWNLLYKTFAIAISRRKIIFNPMDDETLNKPISKKETKKIEALTISQEQEFIKRLNQSGINDVYSSIVLLQLSTGMRIGEVLALSTDCIDFKNNTITVYRTLTRNLENKYILGKHTKTYDRKKQIDKGKRTFPMNEKAKEIINKFLNSKITNINKLLFWDYSKNCLIFPKRINDFLDGINKDKYFSEFTTHKLRHTFITRCQEKGIPLVVIQAMVGHIEGSPVTTETYTSVSLDFMKQELEKIC